MATGYAPETIAAIGMGAPRSVPMLRLSSASRPDPSFSQQTGASVILEDLGVANIAPESVHAPVPGLFSHLEYRGVASRCARQKTRAERVGGEISRRASASASAGSLTTRPRASRCPVVVGVITDMARPHRFGRK